jgi:hypothetical protein
MWALDNRTPFAADRNWTRDKDGVHWWLVAVRATFAIGPGGRLTLADEQLPPVLAPEHFGEPGTSSLRYDSDLLAIKPSTDVVLVASAHAPRGRPAASVPVALRVGPLEKTLVVYGERAYFEGRATTSPIPFVTREIRYELAFGGSDLSDPDPKKHRLDERNPVGRGIAPRGAKHAPAHSIEYPLGDPASKGPAGFGAIDWGWLPRRALAGTYDAKWVERKKPLLPDDYDPAFALCAPVDQRTAAPLRGGEKLGLLNLSPEGTLLLDLPERVLKLRSRFGRKQREHGAMLATVIIEPDDHRLSLVWQSALRVAAPEADYLDITEIEERTSA